MLEANDEKSLTLLVGITSHAAHVKPHYRSRDRSRPLVTVRPRSTIHQAKPARDPAQNSPASSLTSVVQPSLSLPAPDTLRRQDPA